MGADYISKEKRERKLKLRFPLTNLVLMYVFLENWEKTKLSVAAEYVGLAEERNSCVQNKVSEA